MFRVHNDGDHDIVRMHGGDDHVFRAKGHIDFQDGDLAQWFVDRTLSKGVALLRLEVVEDAPPPPLPEDEADPKEPEEKPKLKKKARRD